MSNLLYRVGAICIVDDGTNIRIYKSHTPSESIVIERADRDDLLTCLMQAQDKREDLATEYQDAGSLWRSQWDYPARRDSHEDAIHERRRLEQAYFQLGTINTAGMSEADLDALRRQERAMRRRLRELGH